MSQKGDDERGALLEDRIARLSPAQRALLEARLADRATEGVSEGEIPKRSESEDIPLSFAQYQMWLAQTIRPGVDYNLVISVALTGPLDQAALKHSLGYLVQRHEPLRTTFEIVSGSPVQRIHPPRDIELSFSDFSEIEEELQETRCRELVANEARELFDLARGPLLRGHLLRRSGCEHLLILPVHHMVFDGWSAGILVRELATAYSAFEEGLEPDLPAVSIQYSDFAAWQQAWINSPAASEQLEYWRDRLAGEIPVLELPGERPRPAVRTGRGQQVTSEWPLSLLEKLEALSRREGATLFMTLLAGFKTLLLRYNGQEDVTVGVPNHGRGRPETGALIGLFSNLLVLRTDLSGDPSFRDLLKRVRDTSLDAFKHADIPHHEVVQAVNPRRNLNRTDLSQAIFQLLPVAESATASSGLQVKSVDYDTQIVTTDIEVRMITTAHGLMGMWKYNADLFEADAITRMVDHYRVILEGAVLEPGRCLSDLPLLTEAERQQAVRSPASISGGSARTACVHRLFEAEVDANPDALAILSGDERLTYAELNRRANRLAHHLRELGTESDTPVALCVERCPDLLVGLLGVLKAGGAALPLDLVLPAARLEFMLADARAPLLVTRRAVLDQNESLSQGVAQVVCLDDDQAVIDAHDAENPMGETAPGDLVYVLYTSGSTGRPKGVAMPHRALTNLVTWQRENSACGAGTRTLQFAALGFDVAFQEVFSTLCAGGTLVMLDEEDRRDPKRLLQVIESRSVERLFVPYVALQQISEVVANGVAPPSTLREIVTAGEVLRITPTIISLFEKIPACSLVNQYGPTESHVVTSFELPRPTESWPRLPPIGQPIAGARLRVLDAKLQIVPDGVAGELCIGGVPMARGYLHQPSLTKERFILDPLDSETGARLYRTGDRCRFRPDGVLEFLGRLDEQVKIRGFRVEPGEVESVLGEHPAVEQCAVVAAGSNLERRLVAYVEMNEPTVSDAELRRFLASRVPDYMVPIVYERLDALPLTPSGKLDRRSLPSASEPRTTEVYVAPRDAFEQSVAKIWEEVLGVSPIGVTDDFFDLGGHSLLGVRLSARIEESLGQALPLVAIFSEPTVEGIAKVLRERMKFRSVVVLQGEGDAPALFCVPGIGGHSFELSGLARAIGTSRPCYGLQLPGLNGDSPLERIEEVAEALIEDIRELQPSGPYHLAGYSFGGVVAYELARLFASRGEKVSLLALWDPSGISKSRPWAWRLVTEPLRHLQALRRLDTRLWWPYLRARIVRRVRMLRGLEPERPPEKESTLERRIRLLRTVNRRALEQYDPALYAGPTVLFTRRERFERGDLAWVQKGCPQLQVRFIAARHSAIIRGAEVQLLAEATRACLEDLGSSGEHESVDPIARLR